MKALRLLVLAALAALAALLVGATGGTEMPLPTQYLSTVLTAPFVDPDGDWLDIMTAGSRPIEIYRVNVQRQDWEPGVHDFYTIADTDQVKYPTPRKVGHEFRRGSVAENLNADGTSLPWQLVWTAPFRDMPYTLAPGRVLAVRYLASGAGVPVYVEVVCAGK